MNHARPLLILATVFGLAGSSSKISLFQNSLKTNDKGRTNIPLKSIHSTFHQKGLKKLELRFQLGNDGKRKFLAKYGYHLNQLVQHYRSGTTDIFMVPATDLLDAIKMTKLVYLGGKPVQRIAPTQSQFWLFTTFGVNSSWPPVYQIQSIRRKGKTIRISFQERKPQSATDDVSPYFLWAPIGELPVGTYKLEIYNATRNRLSLVRYVEISPSK